ncbi:FISUMP domain-containing protein, partial [Balneolaceae bacterium ANBcel3]|nr:FISUMP domain-containing protein [Balneolaceae bacterium ANBcel3]
RSFATNEAGTIYGGQRSFMTLDGRPDLLTHDAQEVTPFSARISGEVHGDGGAELSEWGICYGEASEPDTSDTCIAAKEVSQTDKSGPETSLEATGSEQLQGMDQQQEAPQIGTPSAPTGVRDSDGPSITASFDAMKGQELIHKGVLSEDEELSFEITLDQLDPDRTYYARSYAINEAGASYSPQIRFTTRDGLAVLTTIEPFDVTAFSAKTGGDITDDGGAEVTGRGVCWATTENPTLEDECEASGSGTGSFEVELSDLDPDQTYYVRAYGTTVVGTSYGAQQSFVTTEGLATLATAAPSEIRVFSALAGGEVSDEGDAAVTERGVCYSIEEQPTTGDSCEASGSGMGSFEVELSDLDPGQTYYVRAYAVNAAGTAYGGQESFTTQEGIPLVTTIEPFDVTAFSVKTGGDITDDGGAEITGRGVCWATGENPTLDDSCEASGSGTGSYEVELSELDPDQTYYVRAYAINQAGTAYGGQESFTTRDGIPVVTTIEPFDVTAFSAKTGGDITDDGGAEVTGRGVCWATTENPTLEEDCETSGSGTGSFEVELDELDPDQTYYVRAYATNQAGTAYGGQELFTTWDGVRDTETTVVEVTNPATGRIWMDRNLGASRVATSSTDTEAYGDLYQWGRGADGHQKRNSPTTSILSSSDQPGHGDFILAPDSPWDWRSPRNDDLWQGESGTNNPCPAGFRLPTEAEWEAERGSWSSSNASGAFASPLKLPLAGYRFHSIGSLRNVGSLGYYWSSTVSGSLARFLYFSSSDANMLSNYRALGYSVRCTKD